MKPRILVTVCVLLATVRAYSQGQFYFSNIRAPTRLWTIDGPLADGGTWAQMLAGRTIDDLLPVGVPREHMTNGVVYGGVVTVPGIAEFETAYVQMVAWDGALWGTNLSGVPSDQLGRTDAVPHVLGGFILPALSPLFTQPAVVPVPEPSVLVLALLTGPALFVQCRHRRRQRR